MNRRICIVRGKFYITRPREYRVLINDYDDNNEISNSLWSGTFSSNEAAKSHVSTFVSTCKAKSIVYANGRESML